MYLKRHSTVLIVTAVFSLFLGCTKPPSQAMPDLEVKVANQSDSAATTSTPTLSRDDEAAEIARAVVQTGGTIEIEVCRWKNGVPEGWVQFDSDSEPHRSPITDFRSVIAEMQKTVESQGPRTEELSGWAVISRKKIDDDEHLGNDFDWYDCEIIVTVKYVLKPIGKEDAFRNAFSAIASTWNSKNNGRLKLSKGQRKESEATTSSEELPRPQPRREGQQTFGSSWDSDSVTLKKEAFKKEGFGKSDTWLELRVVDPKN